jgi:WD40 repeat protein/lysyl oxidase
MRRTALVLLSLAAAGGAALTLALASPATVGSPAPWATLAYARPEAVGGGVFLHGRGRSRLLAAGGIEPAWSPDSRRIAYIAPGADGVGDVYVADADGRRRGRVSYTNANESRPDWSADGRRLVVEQDFRIVVLRADGGGRPRTLAAGSDPDWSPNGRLIAFANAGDLFTANPATGRITRLTRTPAEESAPAWSPDGRRIAYVSSETGQTDLRVLNLRTKATTALTADPALERAPTFSPDGRRVLFVSDAGGSDAAWTVAALGGRASSLGLSALAVDPVPRPLAPRPAELLPDLEQRPAADLSLMTEERGGRDHFLLGFDSATDNLGDGPITLVASRPNRDNATMPVSQRVRLGSGDLRTYSDVGILRYVYAPSHSHWHVMDFQRYELRRLDDHALVVRDRKSGFCLADHWAHAPGHQPNEPPRPFYNEYCERGDPGALSVLQGTSVGYTDRYPSHFHGQNLDLTGVPAGLYLLVNRANPELKLRELRYENNASALRIRITWPGGPRRPPGVRVLATCPDSDRC